MSIFCNHVYKIVRKEYAYTTYVDEGSIILPSYTLTKIHLYVQTDVCLKCGKTRHQEIRERA